MVFRAMEEEVRSAGRRAEGHEKEQRWGISKTGKAVQEVSKLGVGGTSTRSCPVATTGRRHSGLVI